MRKRGLISILGVLLILAACASAVSAANTLSIPSLSLPTTSSTGFIDLYMDSAPTGVSGYSVTFTISPTTVAQIDTSRSASFPTGVVTGYYSSSWSGQNIWTIKVADVGKAIPASPSATNIKLGSIPVKGGGAAGFATVTIAVNQMDDDSGATINAATVPGNIAVAQPQGYLWVNTTPVKGAQIYVDNVQQKTGSTPITTNASFLVDYGTHTIKVTLANYVDGVQTGVFVPSGGTPSSPAKKVSFTLVRTGGIYARSSPSGATITVDGKEYSTKTPYTVTGLDPYNPAAGHSVIEAMANYYSCMYNGVKVNPGATTTLTICTLQLVRENDYKPYGSIDVDSDPEGASISIKSSDGRVFIGPLTPGTIEIAPGTYTVSAVLDSYLSPAAQSVTVVTHQMSHLDFKFQTKISPILSCLWPPNHGLVDMTIKDVMVNRKTLTFTVKGITSDEATATDLGSGGATNAPDAFIKKGAAFQLRAERSGTGNGRVYMVSVKASNGQLGTVLVCVPPDQSTPCSCIDDGQKYDATRKN